MRILGYGFEHGDDASDAENSLVDMYGLLPSDSSVGDLAGSGAVLAVRAHEDDLEGVRAVLEEHGGEPLVDVDERWTGLNGR